MNKTHIKRRIAFLLFCSFSIAQPLDGMQAIIIAEELPIIAQSLAAGALILAKVAEMYAPAIVRSVRGNVEKITDYFRKVESPSQVVSIPQEITVPIQQVQTSAQISTDIQTPSQSISTDIQVPSRSILASS